VTVSETTIKNSENLGRQLPNSDGQSDNDKRADELRAGSSSAGCEKDTGGSGFGIMLGRNKRKRRFAVSCIENSLRAHSAVVKGVVYRGKLIWSKVEVPVPFGGFSWGGSVAELSDCPYPCSTPALFFPPAAI
jgi:hypothetical protein